MKSILIRDLDPEILDALKRLASYHNRSLQGELHTIIEHAVRGAPQNVSAEGIDIITVRTKGRGAWRRVDIYGDEGR